MVRGGLIHTLCTARRTSFHSTARKAACASIGPGALFKSWKAAMRDRRGKPQGKPGAGGAKPVNPRGNSGARANFLAAENAGEGVTRIQAVQGVTFDAGPTRTWVRGRSTGQLGRRPLSRFGPSFADGPQSWVRRFAKWRACLTRKILATVRSDQAMPRPRVALPGAG